MHGVTYIYFARKYAYSLIQRIFIVQTHIRKKS